MGEGIIDGIKKCGDGYLVTHFKGNLYYIGPNGTITELLNTRNEKLYQADFEYINNRNLLIIPGLWNNKLLFYKYIPQ